MKTIFRKLSAHNSDVLHEEMVLVFGERFNSVNTGPYHGDPEFMFIVDDDFTERDEQRLDTVLNAHDETKLTEKQGEDRKSALSIVWLKQGFDIEAIRDDLRRGDTASALDKIAQFVEAASSILSRL